MTSFIIEGGKPLRGSIAVSGNKNAVLPAMAASLLTDDEVVLENVPRISDVRTMGLLLQDLGVHVEGTSTKSLRLEAKSAVSKQPDDKLVADLRASVLLLGPMLVRFGRATIRHPGGDIIGRRSIDQHLRAFQAMGATVTKSGIVNSLTAKKLHAANIYLTETSVTATENIMMAGVFAEGETVVTNAAAEPHVVCLGRLLKKMGAKIEGLGTHQLVIKGVSTLRGCRHTIRPDHTEMGTWAIATALTDGDVVIHDVHPEDLVPISAVLTAMGVAMTAVSCEQHPMTDGAERVCIRVTRGDLVALPVIRTNVWPGFPTDLMSPTIVLATQCNGTTLAHDWMYEGRMFFVDRLIKMGANIIIADPHRVIVSGPTQLFGRRSASPDIRAGVALVLAALAAKGTSTINMIELIDRGYEHIDKRLTDLGALVKRIP